jgi:hypothetical protein
MRDDLSELCRNIGENVLSWKSHSFSKLGVLGSLCNGGRYDSPRAEEMFMKNSKGTLSGYTVSIGE